MGNLVRTEIAKNLTYYRKRKKFTQDELGKKLGVKRNTVSSWESGINAIDVEMIFQICILLNISVSDLFGSFANASSVDISAKEQSLLEGYRVLSSLGQEVVGAVIGVYKQEAEKLSVVELDK